jgi:hypothetical protein
LNIWIGSRATFAVVIRQLHLPCSRIILNKDTTAWLDGARPANTCILPSFPGNVPTSNAAYPPSESLLVIHELHFAC